MKKTIMIFVFAIFLTNCEKKSSQSSSSEEKLKTNTLPTPAPTPTPTPTPSGGSTDHMEKDCEPADFAKIDPVNSITLNKKDVENYYKKYIVNLELTRTNGTTYYCTGWAFEKNLILTAGHCFVDDTNGFVKEVLSNFKMTRGILNPAKPNPNAVETKTLKNDVEKYMAHPNFNATGTLNDIAFIKLKNTHEFKITSFKPTSYFRETQNMKHCTLVNSFGFTSKILKDSYIVKMTPKGIASNGYTPADLEKIICMHEKMASGDSGGPLMTLVKNKLYVIGVLAGFAGCPGDNTTYTSISPFEKWIKKETGIDLSHD